jgi:outer membrane protein OmpA-like peptidoglycan-associated protein
MRKVNSCPAQRSARRTRSSWAWAALAGIALASGAAAQSTSGVSVDWSALAKPAQPDQGVSVDWKALGTGAAPSAPSDNPVILHRLPPLPVATTAIPKPPQLPAVTKPVAPAVAAIVPPRPPAPPRAAPPAPEAPPVATPAAAPALMPGRFGFVPYAKGQADLPQSGQSVLDRLAAQLAGNQKLRVQLVAFASPGGDGIEARRISLARAVQMRSYLIQKGVSSVRMDVRALGDRNDGAGPPDRVDLVVTDR